MKRSVFPIALVLFAVLALSACGSSPTVTINPSSSITSTPVSGTAMQTPTGTGVLVQTGTPAPNNGLPTETVAERTLSVTETALVGTTTPTVDLTGTPETSLPASAVAFVRLSDILKVNVNTNDQQAVGSVEGVVIERPAATENGVVTPTPAARQLQNPYVHYVLVQPSNQASSSGNEQVLVPWQAFTFDSNSADAQTGIIPMTNLTLNVNSQAINDAPPYVQENTAGFTSAGWDADITRYWSAQGLTIPATGPGAGSPGNQVLMRKQIGSINVVGPNNAVLGQVVDFLVDARTGDLSYAMLGNGKVFNGRTFVVPVNHLNWQIGGQGSTPGLDLGNLRLNFSPETFNAAPYLDSLNGIQLGKDWQSEINRFWENVQGTNQ